MSRVEPAKPFALRLANGLLILPANLLLHLWFSISYLAGFMWLHLLATTLGRSRREAAFQRINSWYYAAWLAFARVVLVGFRLRIDPQVRRLRGAVIIANHLSFLDTILMVALFRRHKTIVKGVMFKVPFMGWVQLGAGYLPSGGHDPFHKTLLERLRALRSFFAAGGMFFVFPEGTRSRTGRLGPFHKGAFNIAAHAGVPIDMILLRNTQLVHPPGKLLLRPLPGASVCVEYLGRLPPPPDRRRPTVAALIRQAEARYHQALGQTGPDDGSH